MNNKPRTNTSKYKASELNSLRPLRSLRWITALTPADEAYEEMEISEFRKEKPQMNADEQRYIHITGFSDFPAGGDYPVTESGRIIHRKGRKERKAMLQEALWSSRSVTKKLMQQRHRTRMTRMTRIFTDAIDPCVSVSSVQSVFYRNWLTLRQSIHTVLYKVDIPTICVHQRSSAVNNP